MIDAKTKAWEQFCTSFDTNNKEIRDHPATKKLFYAGWDAAMKERPRITIDADNFEAFEEVMANLAYNIRQGVCPVWQCVSRCYGMIIGVRGWGLVNIRVKRIKNIWI